MDKNTKTDNEVVGNQEVGGVGTVGGSDIIENIQSKLSKTDNEVVGKKENDGVRVGKTNTFDLKSLSSEQLRELKSMLNATPDSISRIKKNPIVKLRQVDGKVIIDFKNAYTTYIDDVVRNAKVEADKIPVLFIGEKEYVHILYKDFIYATQIECEIVSTRKEEIEVSEGTTVSRSTGQLVDMIRKDIKTFFTISLPNGDKIEIESRLANA